MLDDPLQPSSDPMAVPITEERKKPEETDDNQIDTLINNVNEKDSLHDVGRTSYPVLLVSSA